MLVATPSPPRGPLAASAQAALPASAWQTTMGAFDTKQGIGQDPLIASDRPVWVVVFHGNMETDARRGEAPVIQPVYTEVFDAPTGSLILTAIGVAASP